MSIICIAKGTATMGHTTIGHGGEVTSQTPARWEKILSGEKLLEIRKTVFRYIADGKLKAYKLSQRCVRIDETDLEKFVKGT